MWGLLIVVTLGAGWYGAGHIKVSDKSVWVSCQPGWRWSVDTARLGEYRAEGDDDWMVVYLACRYKRASEGAGMVGYPEMLAYTSQRKWAGVSVISVYPHNSLWSVKEEEREYIATRLVVWEMAIADGKTRVEGESLGAGAAQSRQQIVELIPWRLW